MSMPFFQYHPDPLASGSIEATSSACDCCGEVRGFSYSASFYTREMPKPKLCPWCIASGEAAKKYQGAFSDDHPLRKAGIADEVVREVCERTPGYNSWQQDNWQHHCNDACEFHGDAELAELRGLNEDALADLLYHNMMPPKHWQPFLESYQKGGNPAVYKFVCRYCRKPIYCLDFT